MSSDCSIQGSTELALIEVSGRRQTGHSTPDSSMVGSPVLTRKLSDIALARHLAGVAALAQAEGDLRLAGHLVDVAYDLAGG